MTVVWSLVAILASALAVGSRADLVLTWGLAGLALVAAWQAARGLP